MSAKFTEIELSVGNVLQLPAQGQIRTWYQKIDLSESIAAYLRPYNHWFQLKQKVA
ncbi:hypothetical protein [Nostoc sp. UHCC 0251]|uniref:hypothetical protein n=1 Tax=Nostoc sp. UHCC 0251 TaxID=3110240 RepID=UPI002B1F1C57|nr:hypothetical protein [Nostoc sp. UHCC 0251]MEA5625987.1 hypothetical protein [Nostoc sp. UHCC 0251]